MAVHTDQEGAIVFDDFHARKAVMCRLIGGAVLILTAFALPLVVGAILNAETPVFYAPLLFGGIAMLLWEAHASLIKGTKAGENGAIIIDSEGIGVNMVGAGLTRIEWARVRSARMDQRAVIIRFEPRDLQSDKPKDRISEIRLSAPTASPQVILAGIHRFWTQPGDASHSG